MAFWVQVDPSRNWFKNLIQFQNSTPTCSCSIFRMLNSLWFSTPGNTLTSSKKRTRTLKFWSETTVSSERSSPSFYSAQRERVTRWNYFKNCNFNTTALISKLGATLSSFEFNWYTACSKLHFCTSCLLYYCRFFQPNFEFSSPLKCGEPAPDVLLQVIDVFHVESLNPKLFFFAVSDSLDLPLIIKHITACLSPTSNKTKMDHTHRAWAIFYSKRISQTFCFKEKSFFI